MTTTTPVSPLSQEIETYNRNKEELLRSAPGQIVVIQGDQIFGLFDDASVAYSQAVSHFGLKIPFLVREVQEGEKVIYIGGGGPDRMLSPAPLGVVEVIGDKRADVFRVAEKYGASNVRVFGSVARGEASPVSDVDFLVDIEPGRSLMDLSGLIVDLCDLLGRPVDVAEPSGLHRLIRERVLREAQPL